MPLQYYHFDLAPHIISAYTCIEFWLHSSKCPDTDKNHVSGLSILCAWQELNQNIVTCFPVRQLWRAVDLTVFTNLLRLLLWVWKIWAVLTYRDLASSLFLVCHAFQHFCLGKFHLLIIHKIPLWKTLLFCSWYKYLNKVSQEYLAINTIWKFVDQGQKMNNLLFPW